MCMNWESLHYDVMCKIITYLLWSAYVIIIVNVGVNVISKLLLAVDNNIIVVKLFDSLSETGQQPPHN